MPIYVLLVACDSRLHDTAIRLVGQSTHKIVAVPDLKAAMNALTGIHFDVLVTGAIPVDGAFERFLGAARTLQPALRIVDSRKIPLSPAILRLAGLRSAFTRLPGRPSAGAHANPVALPSLLLS